VTSVVRTRPDLRRPPCHVIRKLDMRVVVYDVYYVVCCFLHCFVRSFVPFVVFYVVFHVVLHRFRVLRRVLTLHTGPPAVDDLTDLCDIHDLDGGQLPRLDMSALQRKQTHEWEESLKHDV